MAGPVLQSRRRSECGDASKELLSGERFQNGDDSLKSGQRARFAASERREPESGQPGLQIAQIVLAQSEVVDEILHAATGLRALVHQHESQQVE